MKNAISKMLNAKNVLLVFSIAMVAGLYAWHTWQGDQDGSRETSATIAKQSAAPRGKNNANRKDLRTITNDDARDEIADMGINNENLKAKRPVESASAMQATNPNPFGDLSVNEIEHVATTKFVGLGNQIRQYDFKSKRRQFFKKLSQDDRTASIAQNYILNPEATQHLSAKESAISRVFYLEYLRFLAEQGDTSPLLESIKALTTEMSSKIPTKAMHKSAPKDLEELMIAYFENMEAEIILSQYDELMEKTGMAKFQQKNLASSNMIMENILFFSLLGRIPKAELEEFILDKQRKTS